MKYKGTTIPQSGSAGVKQVSRGINKGKWQAFFTSNDGMIFTGILRASKGEAMFDLSMLRARIYI